MDDGASHDLLGQWGCGSHRIFGTRQHREFYEICEHTGETESEVATGKEWESFHHPSRQRSPSHKFGNSHDR